MSGNADEGDEWTTNVQAVQKGDFDMSRRRSIFWMLSVECDEVSELSSREADGELSGIEKWAARLHRLFCTGCRRYREQIAFLRAAMNQLKAQLEEIEAGPSFVPFSGMTLPAERIAQIRDRIALFRAEQNDSRESL